MLFPYERPALQSNACKLSLSAPLACEARAERAGALATRSRAERALRTPVAPKVKVTRVTSRGTGTNENVSYHMIFRAPKIKLIFEFVSVFRLAFSCFTAPGASKTPKTPLKKNPKNPKNPKKA